MALLGESFYKKVTFDLVLKDEQFTGTKKERKGTIHWGNDTCKIRVITSMRCSAMLKSS